MIYTGWWFATCVFPYIGNVIIPTDELIFFRGVGQPPTSIVYTVLSNILVCLTIPFPLKADRKFNRTSLYGEDPDRAEGIVGDGSYVSRFILHHLLYFHVIFIHHILETLQELASSSD